MGRLDGRVAIVSGGGTGIGAATARLFASEGAKVVVTGRRPEPIEAVAVEIDGRAVPGDTSDDERVRDAVATAVGVFGGLDLVVANAGLGLGGATADVDDEHWQRTLDVNLTGAFRLARAAIPSLIVRGGGSIVLVSSTAGLVSGMENAAYEVEGSHARPRALDRGRIRAARHPRERALPRMGRDAVGRPIDGRAHGRARHLPRRGLPPRDPAHPAPATRHGGGGRDVHPVPGE
jgi:hypothetical protein